MRRHGTTFQLGWLPRRNPSRSCSTLGCISNQYRSVAAWFRSPPGLCSWQYLKRTWKATPLCTSLPVGCSRVPRGSHRFELQTIDPLEDFSKIFDYSRTRAVERHVVCVDCVGQGHGLSHPPRINSSRSNSAVLPSKWRPWPVTVIAGSRLELPSSHKSRSIILSGMLPRAYGT